MGPRHYLLLTVTGRPRGDDALDAADRRAACEAAITGYLRLVERGRLAGIVVADGTGLAGTRLVSPALEWIGIDTGDYPVPCHRGYEEFRLVDDALARSALLQRAGAAAVVWKLSSRHRVPNLGRVLRWSPRRFDIYGAFRGAWAEIGLLAWTAGGYDRLLRGVWQRFEGGEPPEVVLDRALRAARGEGLRVVGSFLWPPRLVPAAAPAGDPIDDYLFRLLVARKLLTLPWRSLRRL